MSGRDVAWDLVKGAIAGAAATWLMDRATTWMYEHESDRAKAREGEASGGASAFERVAERGAAAVGATLDDDQRARAGTAIHWATGIMAGAAYAVLRRRWSGVTALKGLPFGAGFFLVVDEIMNPLLGFTPGPSAYPWQTHARGLGGHLAFGIANELVLDGLDRVA
jgi:hypothetical protein